MGALEDGEKVAQAILPFSDVANFDPTFTCDVAFDKRGPAKGVVVRNFLRETEKYILTEVLPKFEPLA